jgi:c-di-GMP-binding flagellar brake protein YcgR
MAEYSEQEDSPSSAQVADDVRRWERHDLSIPVNVTAFQSGERSTLRGTASDISRGGMRLFLTRELEPGASVILEFLIPYNTEELVVRGVIRNRTGFNHGVEFLSPTTYQQQMIERTCKIFALLR